MHELVVIIFIFDSIPWNKYFCRFVVGVISKVGVCLHDVVFSAVRNLVLLCTFFLLFI